jgi:hypothetical protein
MIEDVFVPRKTTTYQLTTFYNVLVTLLSAAVIPTQSCSAIHGPLLESNVLSSIEFYNHIINLNAATESKSRD